VGKTEHYCGQTLRHLGMWRGRAICRFCGDLMEFLQQIFFREITREIYSTRSRAGVGAVDEIQKLWLGVVCQQDKVICGILAVKQLQTNVHLIQRLYTPNYVAETNN